MTDAIYDESKLVFPNSIQPNTAISQIFALFEMGADLEESIGTTCAKVDLSNVNLGTANAGKTLQVGADGKITLVTVE